MKNLLASVFIALITIQPISPLDRAPIVTTVIVDGQQFKVEQQGNDYTYVSQSPDVMTQFGLAAMYGSIGLVAHDYLAGSVIAKMQVGDVVTIVTDHEQKYTITREIIVIAGIDDYNLFREVYATPGWLIFQTCTPGGGYEFMIGEVKP